MKRASYIAIGFIAVVVIAGCDIFGATPLGPVARAQAFVADANASPQDLDAMRSHFDSDTADYSLMLDPTFWQTTFFDPLFQPFVLTDPIEAGAGDYGADSIKVTGTIDNASAPPVNVEVHLTPEVLLSGETNYLIRKIVTDPGGANEEIIQNRW